MLNQLSAAELRKELPVEDDEMHEFWNLIEVVTQ